MTWLPPYPIHHKLIEFAIAFVLVLALAYCLGDGQPPRHRR